MSDSILIFKNNETFSSVWSNARIAAIFDFVKALQRVRAKLASSIIVYSIRFAMIVGFVDRPVHSKTLHEKHFFWLEKRVRWIFYRLAAETLFALLCYTREYEK